MAAVNLSFGDDEVVEIPWSVVDEAGDPVIPTAIAVHLDGASGPVVGTLTDNLDGTGTWDLDVATDLADSVYSWHFLVTVGDEVRRPSGMSGTLRVVSP